MTPATEVASRLLAVPSPGDVPSGPASCSQSSHGLDDQRRAWFEGSASRLLLLGDQALAIVAVLLWRAGYAPPGEPVRYAKESLGKAIGGQHHGKAQRQRVADAGRTLEASGLVSRHRTGDGPGTPYFWSLIHPAEPGPPLAWPDAYAFGQRVVLTDEANTASQMADLLRFSMVLDGRGIWSGTRAEVLELLQVAAWPTARRRLEAIAAHSGLGLSWDERWHEGRKKVRVQVKRRVTKAELREEALELFAQLHHPELFKALLTKAGASNTSGRLSPERRVAMARQVVEFQQQYSSPPLIGHALEQTIRGVTSSGCRGWDRYMEKVLKSNASKFLGRGRASNATWTDADVARRQHESELLELLGRAGLLNGTGKKAEARELLPAIEAHAKGMAPTFGGDAKLALRGLRLAFKRGSTDFHQTDSQPYDLDFLPEWDPASE